MDKKDVMYGVLALVIILIIALVIKPLATGQPVNIGLPASATPAITPALPLNPSANANISGVSAPTQPSRLLTPTPTPAPTWDAKVQTVGFVNPSTYGISTNQTFANGTRIDSIPQNVSMTTFASFSGQKSGTTQIINIPFPYWELWYTVDPIVEKTIAKVVVTPAKGEYGAGISSSDIEGSYTSVRPQFTLQVMDADDPNNIVRVITPPGGIDLDLWLGTEPTTVSSPFLKPQKATDYKPDPQYSDPRPWKEKFYAGQRNYYFVINAQALKSYKIDIRIPSKYVGQF
ncbi:hypothetical protein [Methanoregula sp.]|uniref:hypothetical protein n=1 Tax=Methanoregula sp. TaxID=2052170 RepID=UPI00356B27FC